MSPDNVKLSPPYLQPEIKPEKSPTVDVAVGAVGSDTCQYCYGAGFEVVPGNGARRCQCRDAERRAKWLEASRIPRRYEHCFLDNFHNKNQENQYLVRAFSAAKLLKETYLSEGFRTGRGLIFMGRAGVGKTHLSVAIMHGLLDQGVPCLFYEFGSLLKEIQNSYNPISQTSELKVLEPVFNAEVLVLDELGSSKLTDWVRDTMMQIINTRYNNKKLTIFTTNYLDEHLSNADETLEDRIGVRLRSRLYEMCKTVLLEGEDYRKKFDGRQS